jgi:hypothetical protein
MTDFSLGGRIGIANKVQEAIDGVAGTGHNIRIKTEDAIVTVTPTWENDTIERGSLIGLTTAAIASATKTYVPLGSETEIANVEKVEGGTKYTVNVNAGFRNQAMFRSIMETGTGYTSLITDRNEIVDEEVLRKRPLRDTYQFEVLVEGVTGDLDEYSPDSEGESSNESSSSSDTGSGGLGDGRFRPGLIDG